ncbi:MAG: sugar phosphate nucleotidyltransferase, partial [Pyrobaculum sp.]
GQKLHTEGRLDFGKDVIPTAIEAGLPVYGYPTEGYWFDIGTPERYLKAVQYLLRQLDAHELEAEEIMYKIYVQGVSEQSRELKERLRDYIAEGIIKTEGPLLVGRHVHIGKDSYLKNSVIDNYVVIEEKASIEDSVVMDRSYIGKNAVVKKSIVGRHVYIGEGAVVENSVVADDVTIGEGAYLKKTKVWPHKVVEGGVRLESFILL